jgi:hypothetical protein
VDGWAWTGKRLLKYSSLPTSSSWPVPAWNVRVHYGTPENNPSSRDKPRAWAVDGDKIAMGYQACQYPPPRDKQNCLHFLRTSDGSEISALSPLRWPEDYGEVGWLDADRTVTFKNGHVYVEEDHLAKFTELVP